LSIELKKIFLNDYHKDNLAKFVSFAGYSMPINYDLGIIKEHQHVRNAAGIFDVSHMGQILVPVSDYNVISLKQLIPLNFKNLKINKSYYSFILNKKGGIVDDLILSKISYENTEYFYIVYNSGRKNVDEKIFKENLKEYRLLENNSLIAIQGPKAKEILRFLKFTEDFSFMESKVINFLDKFIIINRSGYTGEDGFELSLPNSISLEFIKLIMSNVNFKLCGLGSRDSLRLEAGLSLYGNELNENITPIDASLTWAIHKERLNDEILNGQKTLLTQYKNGSDKRKIGLESTPKLFLRSNMKLIDINKNEIGIITSGGFSPTLNSSIAIAYVNSSILKDTKIYSLIRGNVEELKIVKLPFVLHNYKRG
jgi:aminomethyltransferase